MDQPRLLIAMGLTAETLRASRIDAPIRRLSGDTMGTSWSLSFAAPARVENPAVIAALEETFARVIRQMSNWEPQSALCRFNNTPGWHDLDPEFFHVLSRALEIAALTDGAYNPALAAAVDALGFGPTPDLSSRPQRSGEPGPIHPSASPPHGSRIAPGASGMTTGDWRSIELDLPNRRAFQPGAAALDLSSIAKGYAVDICAARLIALGVPSFLMEIGGEFAGQGVKPDGNPWWVELQLSDMPPAPAEPKHTDAALAGYALATSGDFIRRRDGISHLLDGRTQTPIAGTLSGVAVLAPACIDADAWATALFALGPEEGMACATQRGLAALFTTRTPEGAATTLSPAAQAMLD